MSNQPAIQHRQLQKELSNFLKTLDEPQDSSFSQKMERDFELLPQRIFVYNFARLDYLFAYDNDRGEIHSESLSQALEHLDAEELRKVNRFAITFCELIIPRIGEGHRRWERLTGHAMKVSLAIQKELGYRFL